MNTERKHFEAWWKKHGFGLAGLNIDVKGIVWRGWEARAELVDGRGDREYIYGMKAGWNYGYDAGYKAAMLNYGHPTPNIAMELEEEIDKVNKEYRTCINNRLRESRKNDTNKKR